MNCPIAICDDEPASASFVKEQVIKWAKNYDIQVFIDIFPSAEAFLFQYADCKDYAILLLDIEMGKMNGIELAKRVRSQNREIQIVFLSGYTEYLSDGYEVEALHYILKPIQTEKLFSVLNRAVEKLKQNTRSLLLNLHDEIIRIPFYEIWYAEVMKNYITIHASEAHTVKKTLGELEQELDDSFFRTSRSFLVNLRYIRKITKSDVTLKDGTVIPLSRGLYDSINQAMIRHF